MRVSIPNPRPNPNQVYGTASDADLLSGKWYEIGTSRDLRKCECPSFYPLPAATPGFEVAYAAAAAVGAALPTHVHKTSCGGDWWQLGTYSGAAVRELGNFTATPGWEDVFSQRRIDFGHFYASKDNAYPTKAGGTRRINWGWATVPPQSAQTLPREITFNAAARALQQYPIEELAALRGPSAYDASGLALQKGVERQLGLATGVARTSEVVATFELPSVAAVFGLRIGGLDCTVSYTPLSSMLSSSTPAALPVACGDIKDSLPLLASERSLEIRMFIDVTFVEVFLARGRVAFTASLAVGSDADVSLITTADLTVERVVAYPLRSPWVTPEAVRKQKRVFA